VTRCVKRPSKPFHPLGMVARVVKIRVGAGGGRAGVAAAVWAGFALRCGRAEWEGGRGLPVMPALLGVRIRF
jgi:hypothetical protein